LIVVWTELTVEDEASADGHLTQKEHEVVGRLVITPDASSHARSALGSGPPFLIVTREQVSVYSEALTWLAKRAVIDKVLDEL
jgi:hypothetical protein